MSTTLPSRPKGLRNGSKTLETFSDVDSSATQNIAKAEAEDESEIEESDQPIINDDGIEDAMTKLHQLTIGLVGLISKTVILDRYSWPQLADMHIWYSECYRLFRLALGFGDDNLDSAFRKLKINLDDISVYLRTLVIADVYNRILVTEFPDLPFFSRQWIDAAFDPMVKRLDNPSRTMVKKIAMRALTAQKNVNNRLDNYPEKLTGELFEALNPLLLSYRSPVVDRESKSSRQKLLQEQYGKRLADLYKRAIELRKALSRKNFSYSFFWIDAGEPFNEVTMDAEVNSRRVEYYKPASKHQPKVIATMLPGICRNEGQIERPMFAYEPSKEKNIVLRALVYVGETNKDH